MILATRKGCVQVFWKFWNKGKLQSELDSITKKLSNLEKTNQYLLEKQDENNQQYNKLLRMQYKTTQEILENLENYTKKICMTEQLVTEQNQLKMKNQFLVNCFLELLDDMDLTMNRLQETDEKGQEKETWQRFFQGWSKKILEVLKNNGIREIELLGKGFDPLYAESIGTVIREQVKTEITAHCQIVDVFRRGFFFEDGILLRKAQVITLDESEQVDYKEG